MTGKKHMLECLRRIHAAHDAEGYDLSAWPAEAADEIEHLRNENKSLRHALQTLLGDTDDSDYLSHAEQMAMARQALTEMRRVAASG